MFPIMMKKFMVEQYGRKVTKEAFIISPDVP
jgi:hypothetical protein